MSLISIEENNLGKGLILKNNKLDINNFQDYVWSGKHIFSKPIIFAQDQNRGSSYKHYHLQVTRKSFI